MFNVYVIYNKQANRFYIGQTKDLKTRIDEHNNGVFKHSFTNRFKGCWNLIHNEIFSSRVEALKREKQLKSYQGRKFIQSLFPL